MKLILPPHTEAVTTPDLLPMPHKEEPTLSISSNKIRRVLFLTITFLVSASIAGSVMRYVFELDNTFVNVFVRFFNLALEHNVPTLISFLFLIAASGMSALTWLINSKDATQKVPGNSWLLLASIFLFLSFDEALQIHETLNSFSSAAVKISPLFYYSWTIPYGILALIIPFFLLKLVRALPKKTATLFIISGILYVGGAIVFEFMEGYSVQLYGVGNIADVILYTVEETCELCGIALYIYALAQYISRFKVKITIK